MKAKSAKRQRGFTLVELLVVMVIIAVLVGLSVAGLGYAMRASRNTKRRTAASNIEKAAQVYYSNHECYPNPANMTTLVNNNLNEYFEGSFDPGNNGTRYYYIYSGTSGCATKFVVCVGLETAAGANNEYFCTGNGVGTGTGNLVTSSKIVGTTVTPTTGTTIVGNVANNVIVNGAGS
ncbi:type II secretion system protein [Candidatus Dojkabacteria bacterium]|nr:type II secretion system protein [Candidatus Dojkabacteria bacterium]